MKPTLLTFPHISSYPVLLLLGVAAGWWAARVLAKRSGIAPRHIDNLALMIPLLGLGGARFFARLFYAKVGLWEALKIWKGDGLVFYGGMAACVAGIVIYAFWQKLPMKRLLDSLAPGLALGLAFGRIGCFMAGCCWGDFCVDPHHLNGLPAERIAQIQTVPSISRADFPLTLSFPPRSDVYKTQVKWGLLTGKEKGSWPVHPVQLYEAGLSFGLAALLWMGARRNSTEGLLAVALIAGYSTIRFCTELLRGDNKIGENGFTISQTISIWLTVAVLIYLLRLPTRWSVSGKDYPKALGAKSAAAV